MKCGIHDRRKTVQCNAIDLLAVGLVGIRVGANEGTLVGTADGTEVGLKVDGAEVGCWFISTRGGSWL